MKNTYLIFRITLTLMLALSMGSAFAQDVYVGGSYNDKPAVWKNGTPTILSTEGGDIFSVVVDNGNVYAAGTESSGVKLWKNNEELYAFGDRRTIVYSVAVSENDIYAAGYDNGSGKVWKNGVVEPIGYANAISVNSLFISDGKVYAAGIANDGKAAVWENGILKYNLGADTVNNSRGSSVVVNSNGDVYTAGYEDIAGCCYNIKVWKNNSALYTYTEALTTDYGECLYISGSDIYVAGAGKISGSSEFPRLWKNGAPAMLDTAGVRFSIANSVFVFGGDVYVAGMENGKALLWKNGELTTLASGKSAAFSVFVVSESTGIAETEDNVSVQVYPNPTTGQLRVECRDGACPVSTADTDYHIYNLTGQLIMRGKLQGETTIINVESLPTGIYYLRIGSETVKVVKE